MFAAFPVGFLADTAGTGGGGGGGGSVTVSVLPISVEESGFSLNWVFDAFAVTVSGGSPSAITWSFRNIIGGLWDVFSGQGTAVAAPRVQFIPSGGSSYAEFVCTVTVGGVNYQASGIAIYNNLF